MKKMVFIGVLFTLLLASCSPATVVPTAVNTITVKTATSTAAVKPTLTPTKTNAPTSTATVTNTPLPTLTSTPVAYGPTNFPDNVDPLTGLVVSDPSKLNRRPVEVKINIVPRTSNRPPWGLSFADIVYDYYHNDGYSRFHAIFYGNDAELAGPIRSGRLPDFDLVEMYKGMFTYGSADAIINKVFQESDFSNRLLLEHFEASCPPTEAYPLCRYEPNTVDFLLANTADISTYMEKEGVDNSRQNLDGMIFNSAEQTGGVDGKQLFVRYSGDNYTRWDYDPSTGKYLRFQDAVWDQGQGEEYEPLTDRLTDKQLSASNVVVIQAPHSYAQEPPAEIVNIDLDYSGTAYAFRDGQMYKLEWHRASRTSIITLTYEDGTPFAYKPGTTWYQIVADYTEAKDLGDGAFRWNFIPPRNP